MISQQSGASARVDEDNPWPGLTAFDESASRFFHGRTDEVSRLLRNVLDSPVTVLYGRSGMGKSSLLRAGLFPRLREHHMLPIYVRFDIRPGAVPLIIQLRDAALAAIREEALDAPPARGDESLWAYLHRSDLEIWSQHNQLLRPAIVVDQFEEIFTIGERAPELVSAFRDNFGDLVENRIPGELASQLDDDESLAGELDLRGMNYTVLISLREDYLPDLDGWCALIPALTRLRHRLFRMKANAAIDAVYQPAGGRITAEHAVRVVEIIAGRDLHGPRTRGRPAGSSPNGEPLEVEPALLSLFCRELNDERKRRGLSSMTSELIEGAKRDILSNYYESCVRNLPDGVAHFIETNLITERGFRNSFAREDAVPAHLSEGVLDGLIQARLLRLEDRYGTVRIELTHDVLTTVVREHRDMRRTEEEKAEVAAAAARERQALAAAAARREQELESAQAAERTRRLQSEARAAKRLRRLVVGLALLLIVSVVSAVVATRAADSAERARTDVAAARDDAVQSRDDADAARALAERRLVLLRDGIQIKKAVLTDDRQAIDRLATHSTLTVKLTATKASLGYRGASGAEIFRFTLAPDPATLPDGGNRIAAISYRIHSETFMNPLMVAGPDRNFVATYDGRSCISDVVVLVEFLDPERLPEVTKFDMCAAIGLGG